MHLKIRSGRNDKVNPSENLRVALHSFTHGKRPRTQTVAEICESFNCRLCGSHAVIPTNPCRLPSHAELYPAPPHTWCMPSSCRIIAPMACVHTSRSASVGARSRNSRPKRVDNLKTPCVRRNSLGLYKFSRPVLVTHTKQGAQKSLRIIFVTQSVHASSHTLSDSSRLMNLALALLERKQKRNPMYAPCVPLPTQWSHAPVSSRSPSRGR